MALIADLKQAGLDLTDRPAILRWISALPTTVSERIRLLREYEQTLNTAVDPDSFTKTAQGRYT